MVTRRRSVPLLLLLAAGPMLGCQHRREEVDHSERPDGALGKTAPAPEARFTAERRAGGADARRTAAEVRHELEIVEWAEADVIRVKELNAISIEANEIRCPRIVRTPGSYPVPKNTGWRRIEGHEVEVKTLWAHHVSARLIVAERIAATKVQKVKKPYAWRGDDAGLVRNRIVRVDPSTGRAAGE